MNFVTDNHHPKNSMSADSFKFFWTNNLPFLFIFDIKNISEFLINNLIIQTIKNFFP